MKFEARNPKSETRPKHQGQEARKLLRFGFAEDRAEDTGQFRRFLNQGIALRGGGFEIRNKLEA